MGEKRIDLGLTALDELFMTEEGRQENRLPRIRQIPLDMIDDMPNHPFKVRRDDDMELLIESVRDHGVITPIIVRQKEDGRYETAAGHRRRMASKINGLTTIPAEVRDMTRDEAIILMVESNLQRSTILPSEKAFSYKMRLDAMKRQAGRPRKENVSPVGTNLRSDEVMAQETGDSRNQIHRYIRLTFLQPALLDMVDEATAAERPQLIEKLRRSPPAKKKESSGDKAKIQEISESLSKPRGKATQADMLYELDDALNEMIFRWNMCLSSNPEHVANMECYTKIQHRVQTGLDYLNQIKNGELPK